MNAYGPGKENNSRILNPKRSKDEWAEVVDKVEAAILMSLANRVLADAADRQNQVDEHRRQVKLVELKNFSRRTYVS